MLLNSLKLNFKLLETVEVVNQLENFSQTNKY